MITQELLDKVIDELFKKKVLESNLIEGRADQYKITVKEFERVFLHLEGCVAKFGKENTINFLDTKQIF